MKKYFYLIYLLSALFVTQAFSQTPIYMKTEPDGTVSYSSDQTDGAKKVSVSPLNVSTEKSTYTPSKEEQDMVPLDIKNDGKKKPDKEKNKLTEKKAYEKLSITSITPEQTFQNQDNIPVNFTLEPKLQEGDQTVLLLDGARYGEPGTATSFEISREHLPRGTYTVQVAVIDANKSVLITSDPVKFYVKYHSIQNPA